MLLKRLFILLILLLLYFAMIQSSTSCAWWNIKDCKEGDIALGLAFIHMRKAGGTHVLDIIDAWLQHINCLPAGKKMTVTGLDGGKTQQWDNGNKGGGSPEVTCPNIDILHSEFECMNANSKKYIPSFGKARAQHNISFFTTLRHPISRIISQAFYSGVAFKVVAERISTGCSNFFPNMTKKNYNHVYHMYNKCNDYGKTVDSQNRMPKYHEGMCNCVKENHDDAMQFLRTDETVWLDWIKNDVGFSDRYVDNYFIKRLYVNESLFPLPKQSCWLKSTCKDQSGYNNLKSFIQTPYRLCNPNDYNLKKGFAPRKAMLHVKSLLRDKFDFLILEQMHSPQSLIALNRIFHYDMTALERAIYAYGRRGVEHNTSEFSTDNTSKTKNAQVNTSIGEGIMPPSIQKLLYKRNAEDIELYNYAVKLFFKRYSRSNTSHNKQKKGSDKPNKAKEAISKLY